MDLAAWAQHTQHIGRVRAAPAVGHRAWTEGRRDLVSACQAIPSLAPCPTPGTTAGTRRRSRQNPPWLFTDRARCGVLCHDNVAPAARQTGTFLTMARWICGQSAAPIPACACGTPWTSRGRQAAHRLPTGQRLPTSSTLPYDHSDRTARPNPRLLSELGIFAAVPVRFHPP